MKKLSLCIAAILFSAVGWGQVSNPSIIPVTSAPSGTCTQLLPLELKTPDGTLYSCQNGTWGEISGGGSSPATPFQSPQINQQGALGAQQNVYVAWSGDTLATLSSACASNPTTLEVSLSLTLSPGSPTTLPNNCNVNFPGNGELVNNTSNAITIDGYVTGPPVQHFGGTGRFVLGPVNTLNPVLWFGAACNGSTNDLAAIQAAINASTYGQIQLPPSHCNIAGTLTDDAVQTIGIQGQGEMVGGGINGSNSPASALVETVAGDDAIDVIGTSTSSFVQSGTFRNFAVISSVDQTGSAAGMKFSFAACEDVGHVYVQDFVYGFYLHWPPNCARSSYHDDEAVNTSLSTMTTPVGWYIPSTDGAGQSSVTIRDSGYNDSNGPAGGIGMEVIGTNVKDVNTYNFNVAGGSIGQEVDFTGSGTGYSAGDIHFISSTIDQYTGDGMYFQSLPTAQNGSVSVVDARISSNTSNTYGIAISASVGISVLASQINAADSAQADIRCYQSSDLVIAGNIFQGGSGSGGAANGFLSNSCIHVAVTGNSFGEGITNGINIDSGSSYITGLDTNSFDPSLTAAHQVVNAGTNVPGGYTAQTAVSCSTSGTVTFSQPAIAPSYKQVVAYFNACTGTFSYTYPTAFTNTPQLVSQSITTGVLSSISTTAASGTGSSTTGVADLDGY